MDVRINGKLGYEAKAFVPPVGDSTSIPLNDFVDGDERFNPQTQAVTEVYVGGGDTGYDYVSFNMRR